MQYFLPNALLHIYRIKNEGGETKRFAVPRFFCIYFIAKTLRANGVIKLLIRTTATLSLFSSATLWRFLFP